MSPATVQTLVGYVRVSKKKAEADTFRSPDLQRASMKQWAEAKYGKDGHRWAGWFEDLDQSGVTIHRPALGKAVECAEDNEANIVVFDLSRYSRNVPEGLHALGLLAEKNIRVESASEHLDPSTSEGELSLTLMLAVNQFQLRKYSENWRKLINENRRRGAWHGIAPFGYRRAKAADLPPGTGTAGRIVPDETHAPHVRYMFDRYNEGQTLHRIGVHAVEQGWFKRVESVRTILENPVYVGMVVEREYEVARNAKGEIRLDNHLRQLRRPKKNGKAVHLPGLHEAIIDDKTFQQAQARLVREKHAPIEKSPKARWSAVGRTRCDTCGRRLYFLDKSHTVRGDARYVVCTNRACKGKPGSVRLADLEPILEQFVGALPLRVIPRTEELIVEAEREGKNTAKRRKVLAVELEKLRTERVTLTRKLVSKNWEAGLTEDDISSALEAVREEMESVENQISRQPVHPEIDTAPLRALKDNVVTLADLWPQLSFERRTEALELLGMTVFVRKSRKHQDSLDGRVYVRCSFEIGDLDAEPPSAGADDSTRIVQSIPQKKARPPKGPRSQVVK